MEDIRELVRERLKELSKHENVNRSNLINSIYSVIQDLEKFVSDNCKVIKETLLVTDDIAEYNHYNGTDLNLNIEELLTIRGISNGNKVMGFVGYGDVMLEVEYNKETDELTPRLSLKDCFYFIETTECIDLFKFYDYEKLESFNNSFCGYIDSLFETIDELGNDKGLEAIIVGKIKMLK